MLYRFVFLFLFFVKWWKSTVQCVLEKNVSHWKCSEIKTELVFHFKYMFISAGRRLLREESEPQNIHVCLSLHARWRSLRFSVAEVCVNSHQPVSVGWRFASRTRWSRQRARFGFLFIFIGDAVLRLAGFCQALTLSLGRRCPVVLVVLVTDHLKCKTNCRLCAQQASPQSEPTHENNPK